MMEQMSNLFIYHLRDPRGHSRFYHSIDNPRDLTLVDARTNVQGFYGSEPDFEAFRIFKQRIHKEVGDEIHQQSLSRTFIPRFLFSSLVFLIIFLFLSLAVRDPIPLLDEILIALAGASVVWIVRTKKIKRNNHEAEQELLIRDVIEKGFFVPEEQLKTIEKMWQEVYVDLQNQQFEDLESYMISLMPSNSFREIISNHEMQHELQVMEHTKTLEQILKNNIPLRAQNQLVKSITALSKGKLLNTRQKKTLFGFLTKDVDQGGSIDSILYFVLVVLRLC